MSDEQTTPKAPEQESKPEAVAKTTPPVPTPPKKILTSFEITLPVSGEKITIHKLKAGKYYEAQKLYVEWISDLQSIFNTEGQFTAEELKGLVGVDGQVDLDKVKKVMEGKSTEVDMGAMFSKVDGASALRLQILEIGIGMPAEEITETYYTEDVDALTDKVIELNNFMDNLKKSVVPTVGLGT